MLPSFFAPKPALSLITCLSHTTQKAGTQLDNPCEIVAYLQLHSTPACKLQNHMQIRP